MKKILLTLLTAVLLTSAVQAKEPPKDKIDQKIDRLEALSAQYKTGTAKQPLCVMCDFFSDKEEYTEVFKWQFKNGKRTLVETIHSVKSTPPEELAGQGVPKGEKLLPETTVVENYYVGALPVHHQTDGQAVPVKMGERKHPAAFWISTLSLMVLFILAILTFAWLIRKLYVQFLALSADQKKILSQQTSIAKKQNDYLASLRENDFDLVIERESSGTKKGDYTFTAALFLKNNSGHALKIDRFMMEHDHLDEHSIEKTASKSANLYVGKILPAGETLQTKYEIKMYDLDKLAKEQGDRPVKVEFGIIMSSLMKGSASSKTAVSFNFNDIDDSVALHGGKKLIKNVDIKETKAEE